MWKKDIDTITNNKDKNQIFTPKPFVFEGMMTPGSTKVYLPGQTYTAHYHGFPQDSDTLYMCVHVCKRFSHYPTTNWGIRIIPEHARCPFGGRCDGARLMFLGYPANKKPINKAINMNCQFVNGLVKSQKTK